MCKRTFMHNREIVYDLRHTIYGRFIAILKGYINQLDYIGDHDLRPRQKLFLDHKILIFFFLALYFFNDISYN